MDNDPSNGKFLARAGIYIVVPSAAAMASLTVAIVIRTCRVSVQSKHRYEELYRELADVIPDNGKLVRPAVAADDAPNMLLRPQTPSTPVNPNLLVRPNDEPAQEGEDELADKR